MDLERRDHLGPGAHTGRHGSREDHLQPLRSRGIKCLYVAGLHTDCCARHTSGDAFQRGYDLVWVTDALQAFTDEAHHSGLDYFRAWHATDPERQFRTTDQLVGEWGAARGVSA